MAVPAAKNGRTAARATPTAGPRPRVGPQAIPKMAAVPRVVVRRVKAAKALPPPKPHRRPDRGHGR